MPESRSPLCLVRKDYQPKLPKAFANGPMNLEVKKGEATKSVSDEEIVCKLFPKTYGAPRVTFVEGKSAQSGDPLNIGVVLSGGQAPGGHNVIAGVFDAAKKINAKSKILGFLGGPSGLENGKFIEITPEIMDDYRNTGGFDIIGSGRTKLEQEDQFQRCIEVVKAHSLDCVVIIGGDDSNTNAAVLAEYFAAQNVSCSVVGCPKTIDGDMKNEFIETSFGFDTAAKTYSQLIGNIARDANSAKKYWHFIKLMGRSASHITLEAALQTRPNYTLISEEVEEKGLTLDEIIEDLTDVIEARSKAGKDFGVAIVPEGLIEFIPEVKKLISELNDVMAAHEEELEKMETSAEKIAKICEVVSDESEKVLVSLPSSIQGELLLDRDPHGNVQVSLIQTEKLLIELVQRKLKNRKGFEGKFKTQHHFFGYEGRCAAPSNFDADYAYCLGYSAAILGQNKLTGYISAIQNLSNSADQWIPGGVPASMLMNIEKRHGKNKPVIKKALVELDGNPFKYFAKNRKEWAEKEAYCYPGSIQYFGPSEICDASTYTLQMEHEG